MSETKNKDGLQPETPRGFSLRGKITFGILLTGGIIVALLTLFVYNRASLIINLLSSSLEKSVNSQTDALLNSILQTQAGQIDASFENTVDDIVGLAAYRASLDRFSYNLNQGAYWDARAHLVTLPGGQYGNSASDTASIFISSTVTVDEDLLARLNTTAYLDFYAPNILSAHPEVAAVYFMDPAGATTYYPNIGLANTLPPDFDVPSQIFFKIAAPLYNPQRIPRWTPPYQDPAGTGLITTVAAPVYVDNQFRGVMAADVQLERFAALVKEITVGETGYAFLVDDLGHVIAMPQAGYDLFGIQPEKIEVNESPKQTILGKGSFELQSAARRMVAGGSSVLKLPLNGVNTYVAYAPIPSTGHSLGLIVPVAEMNVELAATQQQTQTIIADTLRLGILMLVVLLIAAAFASFHLGRVISKPVVRLTETAEKITAGQLDTQAAVETNDEIGRLAAVFNTMTARLRDALSGLERQVTERTTALEQRTAELQAVSELARDIATHRDLDTLLSVTVDLVRERFDFYHAGIFLVDDRGEYAILRAATGIAGRKMLESRHKLKVGETGIVGYVTSTGQPRVSLDTGVDAVYFNNPFLPETRSEIALPLRSRSRIIGALDIQSREPNAFNDEHVRIFQLLADQLVAAIENAQLVEQVESTLQELNAAYQMQTQQAWKRISRSRGAVAFEYDGLQIKPVPHEIAQEDLERLQSGKPIIAQTGHIGHDHGAGEEHGNTLLVPLRQSNQVIGVIGIENSDPNFTWTEDEIAIAEAAAERAAIALENARLLEESQRRALKERTIGEITAKIGNVVSIDTIIETAVRELSHSLPGANVAIQIQGTMDSN